MTLDWTGICWGENTPVGKAWNHSFADRPLSVQRLLNNSLQLVQLYDTMRQEGTNTPAVVPILGNNNGPIATIACLDEALAWLGTIRERFPKSFLPARSEPSLSMVLIFDGPGDTTPVNYTTPGFQVAMMSAQLQSNPTLARRGYWSWMDGPPGPNLGGPSVTVTSAFFGNCPAHGQGMWTGPDAVGRRGGYTLYRQMDAAMGSKPTVLLLSQWNEFAGQPNGGGYGADKECYGDSYSRDLSNDIEPTSLSSTDCYMRPNSTCLGWGMYYANLFSALLRGGLERNETLAFITSPKWGANVSVNETPLLNISWAITGALLPRMLRFTLDNKLLATHTPASHEGSVLVDLRAASSELRRLGHGRLREITPQSSS